MPAQDHISCTTNGMFTTNVTCFTKSDTSMIYMCYLAVKL